MDSDRMSGSVAMRSAVALLAAALLAFVLTPAHAQVAPGIVVTSPHVWQPGGSAPPYGVQVLPGGSAELTLTFENRTTGTVARYEAALLLDRGVAATARYPVDPSPDPRCGGLAPIVEQPFPGGRGYRFAVGPLEPGVPLTCNWTVRRVVDGPDVVLAVAGLNGQFVHMGAIPDIETRFEQLTPMIAGVSRSALYRMTVVNPGAVNLVGTPTWGVCSESGGAGMEFRPDGPEPCTRGLFACFGGGSSVSVGPVPAGQQRQCTFSLWFAQPGTQLGTYRIAGRFEPISVSAAGGNVYDPNPSNSSTGPMLTVSAEGVPALNGVLALSLTLTLYMGIGLAAAWHRLRC